MLGDILSTAYQRAQLNMHVLNPKTVSVGDLFIGALIPGLVLIGMYITYLLIQAHLKPETAPPGKLEPISAAKVLQGLLPPLALIGVVLGSIMMGAATPTEAAGIGAMGALLLALVKRQMSLPRLRETLRQTLEVTCMVFMILVGAAVFSLVFRGFGGEELIHEFFSSLPGGVMAATLVVMILIFLLGFILDFIEITFVVVPIVGPILLMMGVDPIWLGIMIALNLQTSFLTPPFGFALFYLRGVAPSSVSTSAIYRGVIPFILLQLTLLVALWIWPQMATWLPAALK
jgi:tripartite ATP-independent transporter DctM subunit